MKGERYLIETKEGLKLIGIQEYSRNINKGVEMKFISKIPHVRKKVKEPTNTKLLKTKILSEVKKNVSILANRSEKNLLINFKWVLSKI